MKTDIFTIFYTDDDKDDRDIFAEAAREVSPSLRVIALSNGDELIRLLENPPPYANLILLDLNMPVKNGYEVLKEITLLKLVTNIPVVIFSTSHDSNTIRATRLLGADHYILKPSSFNSLKQAIEHCLVTNWETFAASGQDFVYRYN